MGRLLKTFCCFGFCSAGSLNGLKGDPILFVDYLAVQVCSMTERNQDMGAAVGGGLLTICDNAAAANKAGNLFSEKKPPK